MVVAVVAILWQCADAARSIRPMRRVLLEDAVSKVKPL